MKLVSVRLRMFRNILDSGDIPIDPEVTCLVGKNESGKTACLQALNRLAPARGNETFSPQRQYPAWLEKRHRREGIDIESTTPVAATFQLDASEVAAVETKFGASVLTSDTFELFRNYANDCSFRISTDEACAVRNMLARLTLPKSLTRDIEKQGSFQELSNFASTLGDEAGTTLLNAISTLLGISSLGDAIYELLKPRIPQFFYFSNYHSLPYSVKVDDVLHSNVDSLNEGERTARSLLQLAGAEDSNLLNNDYESRKRELENVANAITDEVMEYWSQNQQLRVQPDITTRVEVIPPRPPSQPQQQHVKLDELKIRIWDERHALSLPFDEHSTGFKWFFSFIAAFSEYEREDAPLIILLDEPALGLHAKAQADFLRFIEDKLAKKHQVIYTTHSPFMVQVEHLERVRLVEDRGKKEGSKISSDVLSSDHDTLFPLQAALGYDLAQHLFIAPHNLVVEGTSDYTYLMVLSDHLRDLGGREQLDSRWSIVPAGGADCIPAFVALLGQHLEVTVLVDSQKAGHQRLTQLASKGYLKANRIVTVGQITKSSIANIEDLFAPEDYLRLYNMAFNASISVSDLQGNDSVLNKIERHNKNGAFDHGKPADVLLRERVSLLPGLSRGTLDNFESLFKVVNATLV